MRLRSITLENFRGYHQAQTIDLDNRVLLFYGLNGRGKSSLLDALEMALFPADKLEEVRWKFGNQVPLTNRFHKAATGRIALALEEADGQRHDIRQPIQDHLADLDVELSPIQQRLSGYRHRLMFTQGLLRDLMLGYPATQYWRFQQMMGWDSYIRLGDLLERWLKAHRAEWQSLSGIKRWLDLLVTQLPERSDMAAKRGIPQEALDELARRRFEPAATDQFVQSVLEHLQKEEPELVDQVVQRRSKPNGNSEMLPAACADLFEISTGLQELLKRISQPQSTPHTKLPSDDAIDRHLPLPSTWRTTLEEGLSQIEAPAGETTMTTAFHPRVMDYFIRSTTLREKLLACLDIATWLDWVTKNVLELFMQHPISPSQPFERVYERRGAVLTLVRFLCQAIPQLLFETTQQCSTWLRPFLQHSYQQIASQADFSELFMVPWQDEAPPITPASGGDDFWQAPKQYYHRFYGRGPESRLPTTRFLSPQRRPAQLRHRQPRAQPFKTLSPAPQTALPR